MLPFPGASYLQGSETDTSQDSQSGTTSKRSTVDHGGVTSTSLPADSHVRTLARPGKEPESKGKDRDFGRRWLGSLARFDPDSHSWKTPQISLLGDLESFSGIWPRWGSMRNGECWERQPSAPHIAEIESGSPRERFPTPCSRDYKDTGINTDYWKIAKKGKLAGVVKVRSWPTPTCGMAKHAGLSVKAAEREAKRNGVAPSLGVAVVISERGGDGGALNPTWVEWLMGWIPGWTDLRPLGTDRSPSAPHICSRCSEEG